MSWLKARDLTMSPRTVRVDDTVYFGLFREEDDSTKLIEEVGLNLEIRKILKSESAAFHEEMSLLGVLVLLASAYRKTIERLFGRKPE